MKRTLGDIVVLVLLIAAVMVWTIAGIYSIGTALFIDHSTQEFILQCILVILTTTACYILMFPLIASQLSLILDESEEEVDSEVNPSET